jgi:hypothetical protein
MRPPEKRRCPHCKKAINSRIVISWGQTLLSAKASGPFKVRSHEVLARAARARWAKYREERGGRPPGLKPQQQEAAP